MLMPVSGYARVKNLVSDIEQTAPDGMDRAFGRLHAAVQTSGEHGVLAVSVGGGQGDPPRRVFPVTIGAGAAEAGGPGPAVRADATVLCSRATLWRLLEGSYSPVEAFRDGLMRVQGDEKLAKRLLRHLAGPDGLVDCQ
jgi:hypothetical protein